MVKELDSHMVSHGSSPRPSDLKIMLRERTDAVMVMLLDSHVVNCGLSLGPNNLKFPLGTCACMPQVLRGEWNRMLQHGHSPGG